MEKLKILIANETYPPDINGAAKFSSQLAVSLADKGHQVAVIAPSVTVKDEIEIKNNLKIFRMRSISIKKIHPYFRVIIPLDINKKVEKIIKDFKPDIIHIQNHFILGRACLKSVKKNNIPIIGTNHFMPDNLLEYLPAIVAKKANDIMWKDFVKIYNQLDYVTSPSLAAKALIKKIGLKNNIAVISNGVNLNKFKPTKVKTEDFVKFNLDKNIPIFIFVGRLEKDKNVDLIIEATKLVLKKRKIQVAIVGKGKDENEFRRIAQDLKLEKNIIFANEVNDNDLRKLLNLADVYIGSGSAELQGIAVMEAMAMSLPILALNAVALPELVKSGVNGFLFELNKYDLADKMLKIISDQSKLENMGKQSRLLIEKHDQKRVIEKFEKLYQKIIKDKRIL